MISDKKKIYNEDGLRYLKVYANILFKYTVEEKEKVSVELALLSEKIKNGKRLIKINIDLIVIIFFFIVLYTSNSIVNTKNFQNYIYNNINESKTYSESFYKSLSDEIKKINNDFSYATREKDYTLFKNIHSKFELSSWVKNTFTEKVSYPNFLNSNILFGNCWRITMRLYKKNGEDILRNIYKYKKIYEIYPDSIFSNDIEDARNVNSLYFDKKWNYLFSYEKSYKKIGGLYQIICEKDYDKIQEQLSQGTNIYSADFPYFIPAIILTNYNVSSVALDFLLFNPVLNMISYNVLKFAFLPNAKTYKEIVTMAASYNQFSIYFILSLAIFLLIFFIYVLTNIRKLAMLASYEEGKHKMHALHSLGDVKAVADLLQEVNFTISIIELIKSILISITIVTFTLSCFVFLKRFGLLIKKYSNVEKNIKKDFLYPFFIIIAIILGCLAIFSLFSYKLFHISENVNSSMLYVFIFNVCIIFANFQGFNISSIVSEETTLSYFYSIPALFFIVTVSFSFIFFLAIKSFIKRNQKIYDAFIYQYGTKLLRHNNKYKKNKGNKIESGQDDDTIYDEGKVRKGKSFVRECSTEEKKKKTSRLNSTELIVHSHEQIDEQYEKDRSDNTQKYTGEMVSNGSGSRSSRSSGSNSSISGGVHSLYNSDDLNISNESNVYEVDPDELDNKDLCYNDILDICEKSNGNEDIRNVEKEKNNNEKKEKKKALFRIEKIFNKFLNLNDFLPLSFKKKKLILRIYNNHKKKSVGIIFSIFVYTTLLIFIMLFLINDYKKIRESDNLLKYQLENIDSSPRSSIYTKMIFHHLRKNINVNIKKGNFNFNEIKNKSDVIKWLNNSFISFLQNSPTAVGNDVHNYETFKWMDIFSIRGEEIKVNITFREKINSSNNALICDRARKNCYINIKNERLILQSKLDDIALLINNSVERIEISFILFDKNDLHSVLVTIHFVFTSSGYISKNIYFGHLFFKSFNISYFKGVVINLLFITILFSLFIVIYIYLITNFRDFYNIFLSVLSKNFVHLPMNKWQSNKLNSNMGELQNLENVNNINSHNYVNNYVSTSNYLAANNFDSTNYGFYGNYGNIHMNNKTEKSSRISLLFKMKIYLTYICEYDILNLLIFAAHFIIVVLCNEQWKYLNEEIKQFAHKETHNILQYFEIFRDQLRNKEDITQILKKESDNLKENVHLLRTDLRKIQLQWKFRSKLLSSSEAYIQKINSQICMNEEIVTANKNRISSFKQYLQQVKSDL
ncbi:hypothetical protein MKS88_005374 [Plasmodium brasilianum]|uniref:Uncharacterized protein n=1 Tax=Plasmodium brasilianum TaxID=5824 RepID=A0ACB9Y0P4_PLABR|nr:hypothetical protein MKS88_005374 [Plasmodium brasilianum]